MNYNIIKNVTHNFDKYRDNILELEFIKIKI